HRENRSSCRRHDIQHLELRRICVISPRHSEIAENKLWEEREVESDENHQRRESRPAFRIELSADLRPPEVNAAEIRHHHASNHDVVEMGDWPLTNMWWPHTRNPRTAMARLANATN